MSSSIRLWLIFSFGLIVILCASVFIIFISSVKEIETYDKILSDLKACHLLLLESDKLKEDLVGTGTKANDFYLNSKSLREKAFDYNLNSALKTVHNLDHDIIKSMSELSAETKTLSGYIQSYGQKFKQLITYYKYKGFKDYGFEGKMRDYIHMVYEHGDRDIQFLTLKLRRHEKDFLMRKDPTYIKAFNTQFGEIFSYVVHEAKMNHIQRSEILNWLYYYNKYFKTIARIENKIGISNKSGLLFETEKALSFARLSIKRTEKLITNGLIDQKHSIQTTALILICLILILIVFITVYLSNRISHSVKFLTEVFTSYVNSGFKTKEFYKMRTSIQEFNTIYTNFLYMAKEIHDYTVNFQQKVYERTLEINEKKEEILKQQRFIELQYNQLLNVNSALEINSSLLRSKNEETHQSLRYAKRIQKALMPRNTTFNKYFYESFIYSKAKDIISGDFYNVLPLYSEPGEKSLKPKRLVFYAADCTGHGVPGAMISVLGINTINKVVLNQETTNPSRVLEKVDIDFQNFLTVGKKKGEITDGMDIALFCYDFEDRRLEFCNAKFNCIIIRNGQLHQLNSQLNSVGYHFNLTTTKQFTTNVWQIEHGDRLYMLSDGYSDQFGGEQNKKLKRKQVNELLVKIADLPMNEQKVILKDFHKTWKGKNDQTDDITVIGIRF